MSIFREKSTARWVEHHGVQRTGGNAGHFERDGLDRLTFHFGGNQSVSYQYDWGTEEWKTEATSPFRPDSERTVCFLRMAA